MIEPVDNESWEPEMTVVIPRHRANFRMDGDGRWHNRDGPFRHQRIIDLFNAALDKDEKGYFVTQKNDGITEKIYFPYEETALFVVGVQWTDPMRIVFNTGIVRVLDPRSLYIHKDHLYYRSGEDSAKFNQRSLMEISGRISCENGFYFFSEGETTIMLPDTSDSI